MSSCELKSIGWKTNKCRSSEVAEVTVPNTTDFIYITLAKESPIRVFESDEDFYNSINEQETDICHDSSDLSDSDTNSQCSSISQHSLNNEPVNTIATMEVLEYEVASATESENDFSNVSSSGTDDYVLAAFAQAVADNSSATEFAILADTEESDDQSYDSDFAPADYWKCVKCNNKQNNPMYRYCERCYQVCVER
ncbi:E3 ubiquitin-protein ligase Mdm2-like [Ochlerotatus camptorhynchus]|uniref:E3 ubiquitin-protein ligase Mdm2-like n=1 Tax=Ochlerotatus camptorhynchus TaxID=644619 RepID=UPI0031D50AAC